MSRALRGELEHFQGATRRDAWFEPMEPRVMLFDEVTSALDPELTEEVLAVIEQLARDGMTMLLVTHEMGFARRVANTIIFMNEGRIWETGEPEAMFLNPKTSEFELFARRSFK